ncbi:hypothetical protein ABKY54_004528 [Vibrio harveyi]
MFIELNGVTYNMNKIGTCWQEEDLIYIQENIEPKNVDSAVVIQCASELDASNMKTYIDAALKTKQDNYYSHPLKTNSLAR